MIRYIGDDNDNSIYASPNAEVILGRGGNDTLEGQNGDDTILGGDGDDVIRGDGLFSDPKYGYAYRGHDSLTGGAGDDAISGGWGHDYLAGGSGADFLDGDSEGFYPYRADYFGDDTLLGGGGRDTIQSNSGADIIDGGAGRDLLKITIGSSDFNHPDQVVNWDFSDGDPKTLLDNTVIRSIERIDIVCGSGDDTVSGGRYADTIAGNGGDDVLTGMGGQDLFLFNAADGSGGVDRITDFSSADDSIGLNRGAFYLPTGPLSADAFKDIGVEGAQIDADDRVIYDHRTGELFYDPDGSGAVPSVMIAILEGAPALSADDIVAPF